MSTSYFELLVFNVAPSLEEHETHKTCRDVSERILTEKKSGIRMISLDPNPLKVLHLRS